MALVKEDGTGVVGANAYEDVAGMKAYFLDRGTTFTGPDATLETKLVQATDFIDLTYYRKFFGLMIFDTQELQFPRDVYGEVIPDALRFSTSEFALEALTDPLFFSPTVDPSGKTITRKLEVVGPIKEETVFSQGGGVDVTKKTFLKAERWLSFLIASGGGVIR